VIFISCYDTILILITLFPFDFHVVGGSELGAFHAAAIFGGRATLPTRGKQLAGSRVWQTRYRTIRRKLLRCSMNAAAVLQSKSHGDRSPPSSRYFYARLLFPAGTPFLPVAKTTGIPQEPGSSCSNQHAKQELHVAQHVFPVDVPADYWVTVTMVPVKIVPKCGNYPGTRKFLQ
jgi:hypothetical protein